MQHHNAIAENVLGTMGTICWTIQVIPQVWKSYRSKSTDGLSQWLMLMWGSAAVFLGTYAILQDLNIPLIVQAQLFGFLCFLSWGQCQFYGVRRTRTSSIIMTLSVMILAGVLEYVLIFVTRPSHDRGNHTATTAYGIIAAVLISSALFPQYWEIYKYKEVIGISILFMLVDLLGGVFNDLSLAFRPDFDVVAAISYTLVVVLDGVVIVLALILNPLARRRRRREGEHNAAAQEGPEVAEVSL